MSKLLKSLIAAAASPLLAAPVVADQPQDAYTTTKVKIELMTADGLDPLRINVDTLDGIVTLHGQVESAAAKTKAAQEARSVKGVKEVRDMLAVVPKSAKEQVAASDDQIQKNIETALENDAASRGQQHQGQVGQQRQRGALGQGRHAVVAPARALRRAQRAGREASVASEIKSPDELGDKEIWNEKPEQTAAKSSASDTWVTTKVKTQLMAEPGISPLKVNVDTRDGVVTLFGSVETASDKTAAERSAMKVDGVKSVENELQVVPGRRREARRGARRPDPGSGGEADRRAPGAQGRRHQHRGQERRRSPLRHRGRVRRADDGAHGRARDAGREVRDRRPPDRAEGQPAVTLRAPPRRRSAPPAGLAPAGGLRQSVQPEPNEGDST